MKFLVITNSVHFDKDVKHLLEQADVKVYSQMNINGHSEVDQENLRDNWFAVSNQYDKSSVFFSFTEDEKANKVIQLSSEFNQTSDSKSKIRAFIMSVDNHNL
ncbi:MAG: hypothetical protein KDD32_11175 [Bacteroidetes bacterium]|nr:hypothetical protein [Bacteroidota bacterium]